MVLVILTSATTAEFTQAQNKKSQLRTVGNKKNPVKKQVLMKHARSHTEDEPLRKKQKLIVVSEATLPSYVCQPILNHVLMSWTLSFDGFRSLYLSFDEQEHCFKPSLLFHWDFSDVDLTSWSNYVDQMRSKSEDWYQPAVEIKADRIHLSPNPK